MKLTKLIFNLANTKLNLTKCIMNLIIYYDHIWWSPYMNIISHLNRGLIIDAKYLIRKRGDVRLRRRNDNVSSRRDKHLLKIIHQKQNFFLIICPFWTTKRVRDEPNSTLPCGIEVGVEKHRLWRRTYLNPNLISSPCVLERVFSSGKGLVFL